MGLAPCEVAIGVIVRHSFQTSALNENYASSCRHHEVEGNVRMKRAVTQRNLLTRFMAEAPFQPATNLWRCVELPVLAEGLPKQGRGLDVGCGDGVLTGILRDLVAADWQLTGLDLDPAETALARETGYYETVHTCGAAAIPEPTATFDFAFSNSVLEHIPELTPCLQEIARCLKPGGLFLATVPSPHFHECLRGPTMQTARSTYLEEIDDRLAHRNYWSMDRWQAELQTAGMNSIQIVAYLSRKQVRRWEFWSHWTGGLLYRFSGRKKKPIALQRGLGLRRPMPRLFRFLAAPIARMLGTSILGDRRPKAGENGCYLVTARKQG